MPSRNKQSVPTSGAVDSLLWQVRHLTPGIPWPQREYHFHPTRKYAFDVCWPALSIAIEVDGGIWNYGRHNRATGMVEDMHKGNEAVIYGYRVLHFRPEEIVTKDGRIIEDALKIVTQLFKTLGFDPGGKKA